MLQCHLGPCLDERLGRMDIIFWPRLFFFFYKTKLCRSTVMAIYTLAKKIDEDLQGEEIKGSTHDI